MESTKHEARILYVYDDKGGHRVVRHTQNNPSNCTHCNGPFKLTAAVAREEGESHESHQIRAQMWKRNRKQ